MESAAEDPPFPSPEPRKNHTGPPASESVRFLWSTAFPKRIYAPALNENGSLVFIGSWDGALHALRTSDGSEAWNFSTGARIRATPTPASGLVIFGSTNGNVYAVKESGALKWKMQTDGAVESTAAVWKNEVAFVGSSDNFVYAVSAKNGSVLWRTDTGGPVRSSPSLSADGSVVYVGGGETNMYALDATTGAVVWRVPLPGSVGFITPAVAPGGTAVFMGFEQGLAAFAASDGKVLWFFRTGALSASPTVHPYGSLVYVGDEDGYVYGLHTDTGDQAWNASIGSVTFSAPVLSPDAQTLYIGSSDFRLYALDTNTGAVLWTRDLGSEVSYTPALSSDGRAIYATAYFEKKLWAIGVPVAAPTQHAQNVTGPAAGGAGKRSLTALPIAPPLQTSHKVVILPLASAIAPLLMAGALLSILLVGVLGWSWRRRGSSSTTTRDAACHEEDSC